MELLLYITSFIFFVFTYFFYQKEEQTLFTKSSRIILFTATVIYSFMGMLFANNPDTVIRLWRYLDWFITVPVLIYQMYFFLKEKYQTRKNLITLILSSLTMLFFGLIGELHILDKVLSNSFGTLFMFLTFYLLISKVKIEHKNFFMSICLLWLFYPTVYLFNDNILTIILFSITDLIAKIGSSFYIHTREKSILVG